MSRPLSLRRAVFYHKALQYIEKSTQSSIQTTDYRTLKSSILWELFLDWGTLWHNYNTNALLNRRYINDNTPEDEKLLRVVKTLNLGDEDPYLGSLKLSDQSRAILILIGTVPIYNIASSNIIRGLRGPPQVRPQQNIGWYSGTNTCYCDSLLIVMGLSSYFYYDLIELVRRNKNPPYRGIIGSVVNEKEASGIDELGMYMDSERNVSDYNEFIISDSCNPGEAREELLDHLSKVFRYMKTATEYDATNGKKLEIHLSVEQIRKILIQCGKLGAFNGGEATAQNDPREMHEAIVHFALRCKSIAQPLIYKISATHNLVVNNREPGYTHRDRVEAIRLHRDLSYKSTTGYGGTYLLRFGHDSLYPTLQGLLDHNFDSIGALTDVHSGGGGITEYINNKIVYLPPIFALGCALFDDRNQKVLTRIILEGTEYSIYREFPTPHRSKVTLIGILCHMGGGSGFAGHYVGYFCSVDDKKWYKFNNGNPSKFEPIPNISKHLNELQVAERETISLLFFKQLPTK